jgi:hypothetical protein
MIRQPTLWIQGPDHRRNRCKRVLQNETLYARVLLRAKTGCETHGCGTAKGVAVDDDTGIRPSFDGVIQSVGVVTEDTTFRGTGGG